jgi:L-methionine (R)-S-oxide reductase
VCGIAAAQRTTLVVADVDAFPGHIACDAQSKSEIVVPIMDPGGNLVAVLDVDSHRPAAFDDIDAAGLAPVVQLLGKLAW